MERIILASGSPRRKELLERIGWKFDIITSDVEEISDAKDPGLYVEDLSRLKAKAVSKDIEGDALIIGADTIVYHNGVILGKPYDKQDAKRTLLSLSGDIHQVYTGVTLIRKHGDQIKLISFHEKTDVHVAELSDKEIDEYIATGEPMDKAGSYGIQGRFTAYVSGINGDYNNVVGLPVARIVKELKTL